MELPAVLLHKRETESTMDDARSALLAGLGHGTVCSAEHQTRGRGRLPGRRWETSRPAVLFTVILSRTSVKTAFPPTQLLALALCRRLERAYGLLPAIKWPNDVLIDGRKIAGILVETEGDFLLGGVGFNLHTVSGTPDYRYPAAGLADFIDSAPRPTDEIEGLCREIHVCLERPPHIGEIEARLTGMGGAVAVSLGGGAEDQIVKGTILGLGADGALLIGRRGDAPRPVYSGEIKYEEKS